MPLRKATSPSAPPSQLTRTLSLEDLLVGFLCKKGGYAPPAMEKKSHVYRFVPWKRLDMSVNACPWSRTHGLGGLMSACQRWVCLLLGLPRNQTENHQFLVGGGGVA